MQLPQITLPQIDLPFNIPLLMHPPIIHFLIAIPVIVLLLELVNLILRKRAIGTTSFFLLILTVVAAVAAYLTGSVDGKEAYPLLSDMAQSELKEHKLLGTYLLIFSVVVLVFKILSSATKKGIIKALYMLLLIGFVAGLFYQGKEGGDLVYKYGVNVEKVQDLESDLDDAKEEIEELEENAPTPAPQKSEAPSTPQKTLIDGKPVEEKKPDTATEVEAQKAEPASSSLDTEKTEKAVEEKVTEIKESTAGAVKSAIDTGSSEAKEQIKSAVDAVVPGIIQ